MSHDLLPSNNVRKDTKMDPEYAERSDIRSYIWLTLWPDIVFRMSDNNYWHGKPDVGHAYNLDLNNDTETNLITLLSRNYEQSQPWPRKTLPDADCST